MKTRFGNPRSLSRALESRYWREREAREVLTAWGRSGEPASVFARRHGLSPSRLLRWKARLSAPARRRRTTFHPVKVLEAAGTGFEGRPGSEIAGSLELVLGGSRRIVVRRGFDPELLLELVRVLESRSC